MKWRLIQFSTVVAGQSHNPTILNPDFLREQGIVPKSWGWEVAKTLTTPPLAVVTYTNGVVVSVEQNKLQVVDPNVEDGPSKSKVVEIASAYVTILPHVRYTAVGNNFQSVHPIKNATELMKCRFLKDGPWFNAPGTLKTVGIALTYPLEPDGQFSLNLDAGEASLPNDADQQSVVIACANFNRECAQNQTHESAVANLGMAMNDWAIYEQSINKDLPIDVES